MGSRIQKDAEDATVHWRNVLRVLSARRNHCENMQLTNFPERSWTATLLESCSDSKPLTRLASTARGLCCQNLVSCLADGARLTCEYDTVGIGAVLEERKGNALSGVSTPPIFALACF